MIDFKINLNENEMKAYKLEKEVLGFFLHAGWIAMVGREVLSPRDDEVCPDILLFTDDGKCVGAVITKTYQSPQNFYEYRYYTEKIFLKGISFFLLFCKDSAYLYRGESLIQLTDIPTPENYQVLLRGTQSEINAVIGRPPKIEGSPALNDLLQKINELQNGQNEILKQQKSISYKLDVISEQIQKLAESISDYQKLAAKQLQYADNDDQIETILASLSDQIVEKIQDSFCDNIEQSELSQAKSLLSASLGRAWDKLSDASQKYLISAELMYKKQSVFGDLVDYSGVCLLVTKALELELHRRFYTNYLVYLKTRFGEDAVSLKKWPSAYVVRSGEKLSVLKSQKFTLGSISYAICSYFPKEIPESKKASDFQTISDYVNAELFVKESSPEETRRILNDVAAKVIWVKENFRDPSAHKNELNGISARKCIDYVIEVEKALAQILNLFKW